MNTFKANFKNIFKLTPRNIIIKHSSITDGEKLLGPGDTHPFDHDSYNPAELVILTITEKTKILEKGCGFRMPLTFGHELIPDDGAQIPTPTVEVDGNDKVISFEPHKPEWKMNIYVTPFSHLNEADDPPPNVTVGENQNL